jgi:hypothetical protein
MHENQVGLPDGPGAELLVQKSMGSGILGKKDNPACLLINTMDDIESIAKPRGK